MWDREPATADPDPIGPAIFGVTKEALLVEVRKLGKERMLEIGFLWAYTRQWGSDLREGEDGECLGASNSVASVWNPIRDSHITSRSFTCADSACSCETHCFNPDFFCVFFRRCLN